MQIIRVKQFISPIFTSFVITAFVATVSTEAKAEYYEPCDYGYWVETPVYHSCKPYKKHHKHVKKKKTHIKKHYYQTVVVPVYAPTCVSRCCCDDCCGNYNPDLTTGDDDPSIYPDLNIDR